MKRSFLMALLLIAIASVAVISCATESDAGQAPNPNLPDGSSQDAAGDFTLRTVTIDEAVAPPYTLGDVAEVNGRLEVNLIAQVEGLEPVGEKVLITGSTRQDVSAMEIASNGSVLLVFDPAPPSLDDARVELGTVSIPIDAGSTQPAHGDEILGPGGEIFRITGRAPGARGYEIHYEPTEPTGVTVQLANIKWGDERFATIGTGVVHRADGSVREAYMSFTRGAAAPVVLEEAVLEVTSFREMVRFVIPLKAGD